MTDGFATDPAALTAAAGSYDAAADALAAALARCRAALDAAGDAWGDDEQGAAFAARYRPTAADGLAAVARSVDGVRGLGGGLRASATQYRGTEEATRATLDPGR